MNKMPVVFVGHGSLMNVIEDNEFTKKWEEVGKRIPRPTAVLCVSAHWFTNGYFVSTVEKPATIHDFYDFPQELYEYEYRAKGAPDLAKQLIKMSEGLNRFNKLLYKK